jgi:hypothetical protein
MPRSAHSMMIRATVCVMGSSRLLSFSSRNASSKVVVIALTSSGSKARPAKVDGLARLSSPMSDAVATKHSSSLLRPELINQIESAGRPTRLISERLACLDGGSAASIAQHPPKLQHNQRRGETVCAGWHLRCKGVA